MRKILSSTFCLMLVACGSDKSGKDSEEKEAQSSEVEFSGYVQKAFTIKVNKEEFSDSEDFYTRFIEELVKPSYPDVTDVKLEGKYGLDEFGSMSKVYMSSMAAEGHLYEGRTDAQSKFTVQVQAKALDETFKARVVIRIGLEVTEVGSDGGLHYCFLLHGNKEGISVSESSKPIIFEEFATQLTKYKCEDVNEDTLVLPGVDVGGNDPGGVTRLRAAFSPVTSIASALLANWEGSNELKAATMSADGDLVVAKAPIKRKDDGKWCIPIVRVANLSAATEYCVGDWAAQPQALDSIAVSGASLVGRTLQNNVTFKSDGSQWDEVASSKTHHRVLFADKLMQTSGKEICTWPDEDCEQEATSNKCDLGYPQTVAWYGGAILAANGVNSQGSGYCGAGAIHVMSSSLAYQKKYSVSTLDVPAAEFASSKLASHGNKLYMVSLAADKIVVRKVDLTEE